MRLCNIRYARYAFKRLASISKSINRIDCNSCNGYHDEKDEISDDKRRDRLLNMAKDIAKEYLELEIYHQSDPRGYSLYLVDATCNNASNYTNGVAI